MATANFTTKPPMLFMGLTIRICDFVVCNVVDVVERKCKAREKPKLKRLCRGEAESVQRSRSIMHDCSGEVEESPRIQEEQVVSGETRMLRMGCLERSAGTRIPVFDPSILVIGPGSAASRETIVSQKYYSRPTDGKAL